VVADLARFIEEHQAGNQLITPRNGGSVLADGCRADAIGDSRLYNGVRIAASYAAEDIDPASIRRDAFGRIIGARPKEGVNAGDFIPPQPTPPKPPATTFPTSPVDAFIPRPGGPLPPLPPLPPPPIPPEGGAWPPAGGGPEGGEGPDPTWPEGTSPPPPAPGGAEPPSLLRAALPFAVGAGALGLFLMLR